MQQQTSNGTPPRTEAGMFSWLSRESFSSLLRNLTSSRPEKELMSAIRAADLGAWHVDTANGVVSFSAGKLSARFFPKARGEETWLVASTPSGEITVARNNPVANQIERRVIRRIDGYRAQEARGISPEWLMGMSDKVTDRSIDWKVERGGVERTWFSAGSYEESATTSFSTTTSTNLGVLVRRVESVMFISLKDAQREDQRYAEQSIEFEKHQVALRSLPFPLPGMLMTNPVSRRPDLPLRYGAQRSVSFDVHVNSPVVDKITAAFGLNPKPVVSLRREERL